MSFESSLAALRHFVFGRRGRPQRRPEAGAARSRLGLEALEGREVPAVALPGVADWGASVFAPYVNVPQPDANGNRLDLAAEAKQANAKFLTLGFMDLDSSGNLSWDGIDGGGLDSDLDNYVEGQIDGVRNAGGDVMVSFGGEADQNEPANFVERTMGTGPDAVDKVFNYYDQVVKRLQLTHVDFDLEGTSEGDPQAWGLRAQAITRLQEANPGLQVEFTLEGAIPNDAALSAHKNDLTPFGMDDAARGMIDSALTAGVKVGRVNLMTMDFNNGVNYFDDTAANHQIYGSNGLPYAGDDDNEQGLDNGSGVTGLHDVADVVISNAVAERQQLAQLLAAHGVATSDAEVRQMVGITPDVGRNYAPDGSHVIFSVQDAARVEAFAQAQGVGRISMWSLNRDHAGGDPLSHSETNSSVEQTDYEFSRTFAAFASQTPAARVAPAALVTAAALVTPAALGRNQTPAVGVGGLAVTADVNGDGASEQDPPVSQPGSSIGQAIDPLTTRTDAVIPPSPGFAGAMSVSG